MRNKTRKFIWSAPIVAALAIVGALALFGVLAMPNADTADAQSNYDPPRNVRAEVTGNAGTSITVRWAGAIDNTTVSSFEAQWKKASEADSAYVATGVALGATDGSARNAVITGLTAGTALNYRVRAVHGANNYSEWVSGAPITPMAIFANTAPTGVTVTIDSVTVGTGDNADTASVTVSWTAPAVTTTASAATGYSITAEGEGTRTITQPVGTATTGTITGVQSGNTVVVTATNSANTGGTGAPAVLVTFTNAINIYDFNGVVTNVDSTSTSAAVNITVSVPSLPVNLPTGSSIVVYLEDDFQVPASIPASAAQFSVTGTFSTAAERNDDFNTGTVAATIAPEVKTGAYVTADKKDYAIRVYLPNFCTDGAACGPVKGQSISLKLTTASGIKNPTEQDSNSTYVDVLGPVDGFAKASDILAEDKVDFPTVAKISLSKVDGKRGSELTVTGSGFNDGTSAGVYVVSDGSMPTTCEELLANTNRTRVGAGTVGSDDKVAVTFEVTVPTFMPGNVNHICMVDGEGRTSDTDVEDYKLKPSISVSPATANVGDTVTIFAQDFPANVINHDWLKLAGQSEGGPLGRDFKKSIGSISPTDGSASGTFVVPSFLEGTVKVESAWQKYNADGTRAKADDGTDAVVKADTKITIIGSSLSISKAEALPNELLTITGDGFGGDNVAKADITIDGVPLSIHSDSLNTSDQVDVSSAGQFVATIILWPDSSTSTNPTLTAGVHTIDVEDDAGFSGSVTVTIPAPTVKVTPAAAGPRDVVTISGENWPVENLDGGNIEAVTIDVTDGARKRTYSVYPDGAGRFFQEHQVHSGVTIPSTSRVEATYDDTLVKLTSYEVPEAVIDINPMSAQPGDQLTLSVDKMPVYAKVSSVQIASREVIPVGNFSTDRTGSVTVDGVVVPGLDPGVYSVLMRVGDTVAIGSVEVLSEGPIGTEQAVADATAPLGDSLSAVFFFDNVSKSWSFYDPRPEFAELNTLSDLVNGQAYWVLVTEDVDDVVLNSKSRSLSCSNGDCWNLVIW